jgi:hypothetical protein
MLFDDGHCIGDAYERFSLCMKIDGAIRVLPSIQPIVLQQDHGDYYLGDRNDSDEIFNSTFSLYIIKVADNVQSATEAKW